MNDTEIIVRTGDESSLAMGWLELDWPEVRVLCKGQPLASQWILDADGSGGMLLIQFDAPGRYAVVLQPAEQAECGAFDGRIDAAIAAVHDASKGGLPQWNDLEMTWDDSISERVLGAVEYPESMVADKYSLAHDRNAEMEVVSEGAMAGVVRTRAHYCDESGARAPGEPHALYDWYYFRHAPVVWVRGKSSLGIDRWRALRFAAPRLAELDQWCAGFPREEGACTEEMRPTAFDSWAMLHDNARAVGVVCGSALIEYDRSCGLGGLVADYSLAKMKDRTLAQLGIEEASAFFWVGAPDPEAVAELSRAGSLPLDAVFTRDERPSDLVVESGGVSLGLSIKPDGVVVSQLEANGQSWQPEAPRPVFTVAYGSKKDGIVYLDADEGWGQVQVDRKTDRTTICFSQPPARPDASVDWVIDHQEQGLEMVLEIRGAAVRSAIFPRLTLREPEGGGTGFVPLGQGMLEPDAFRRNTRYRMPYAGPFAAMSYMGVYAERGDKTGLYLAWHDPQATRKDMLLDALAHRRSVVMTAHIPAEGMTRTAQWTTPMAALRATRKGWWGLVEEYRDYARSTPWWAADKPEKTWIDDIDWWVINSVDRNAENPMEAFVQSTVEAVDKIGVAPAVHAYNWHVIPFDNDYPHYIPARPGFDRALAELAQHGVQVTPYINGRLWDTRDKGVEDWQFSAVAKPAVTKNEDGDVVFEIYGSKEADESFTQLGVMCPSTALWQDKVADLVRQITLDIGASGVYIDQIAAMAAVLCFDETHGHPLGNGGWWRQGYGRMLEKTRSLSDHAALTTECNAEPYVGWLDAYLMWHCMFPGQVPAFSAVYSSRVRLFGRATPGGLDNLRALMAQSWVYGEQIGWFSPSAACDSGEDFARFLTAAVGLRGLVRQVIQQGSMLMPPAITGGEERPYVWGWDARRTILPPVLSSLWRRQDETILLLVNHIEEQVDITWDFNAAQYGYENGVIARRLDLDNQVIEELRLPARGRAEWAMEPCTFSVWRLHGAP